MKNLAEMLKFIHKIIYKRDKFFPICDKSKALLNLFGFSAIDGHESMNLLKSIIDLEVEEMGNKKNIPFRHRKSDDRLKN